MNFIGVFKNIYKSLCLTGFHKCLTEFYFFQTSCLTGFEKLFAALKTIKNNYLSTKNFWTPKHCWYKILITEHPKTSHKLSKTIGQAEKLRSNSSLCGDFFERKNVKITNQAHVFKGFASSYTVEILNPFTSELQLKVTESGIKFKLIF